MARKVRRNPHETQAKLATLMAAIGALCVLVLIVGVFHRFDFGEFTVLYKAGSLRYYGILGATLLGVGTGAIGFFVGLNSAGQQRNSLSKLAWFAFFSSAGVILMTLCLFVVFWFAKESVG